MIMEEDDATAPSLMDQLSQIEFRLHEIAQVKQRLSKEMGELDKEAARLKKEQDRLEAARIVSVVRTFGTTRGVGLRSAGLV